MRISGPLIIIQLLETTFLTLVNYSSLIATNAARFKFLFSFPGTLFIGDLVPGTYSTPGNQLCLFETWIPGTYSTPGNQLCLLETWSQVLIQHPATSSVYWRLVNNKNTHEAMIRGLAINYL